MSLVAIFLVLGCSAPSSLTPLSVQHQTPTTQSLPSILASATADFGIEKGRQEEFVELPTPTPKPTSTPEPGLRTTGPYFSYFRNVDSGYQLVMMDADGKGRKVISLPQQIKEVTLPNGATNIQMRFVSPDGRWMAFYTGFAGNIWQGSETDVGPYNLVLNLLDLATGEMHVITPLLSKDYPENFKQAEKQLNNPYVTAFMLRTAFLNGITESIAWSPDSRYLAFAGQMDGMSSDLYVYDTKSNSIRRLSSGPQELQWISWSPDGKWIIHSSVYSVGAGMTFDVYAASVDGEYVHYLSTNSLYGGVEKWQNSHAFFETDSQNGPGSYGLRLVDINTGAIIKIWDGSYFSYSVDRDGRWAIVNAMLPDVSPDLYSGNDPEFRPGPYLIDLVTLKKTKVEFPSSVISVDYEIFPFGLNGQKFILMGAKSKSYFLSENFELSPLNLNDARIYVSPSLNYWASLKDQAIEIYSSDNTLVVSISVSLSSTRTSDLIWMPDSSGFFIVDETNIYSVIIPIGEISNIETQMIHNLFDLNYKWVGSP